MDDHERRMGSRMASNRQELVESIFTTTSSLDPNNTDHKVCTICTNEIGVPSEDGDIEYHVKVPKCGHVFGDSCLKIWVTKSDNTCPVCRGDIIPPESIKTTRMQTRERKTRDLGTPKWLVDLLGFDPETESRLPEFTFRAEPLSNPFAQCSN